jgi:hypothetical protein
MRNEVKIFGIVIALLIGFSETTGGFSPDRVLVMNTIDLILNAMAMICIGNYFFLAAFFAVKENETYIGQMSWLKVSGKNSTPIGILYLIIGIFFILLYENSGLLSRLYSLLWT